MIARHGVRTLFVLAALLLAAAADAAAQGAGQIVGRVVDAATGRGLTGARVAVQGAPVAANTGVDGRYTLNGVPAGSRTLTVSLLGYGTKTVTGVEVPAGGSASMDVSLSAQTLMLEGLTVSAERERGSVTRALDEQRTAVGVVNAISAEQIARSPDSDVAQSIRRVSGVTVQEGKFVVVRGLGERYTTTSLNGARIPSPEPERRVVPLDLFPSGVIQTVTTSKTFTPNLSGDFSGAMVNIRTQEYPRERSLSFSASTGMNPATFGEEAVLPPPTSLEWLGVAGAERDLPGEIASAGSFVGQNFTSADVNRFVNSFRNVWLPEQQTVGLNGSLSASLGGTDAVFGRELGYVGTFSYSRSYDYYENRVSNGNLRTDGDSVVAQNSFAGSLGSVGVQWGGVLNLSTELGSTGRISFNNLFNRATDSDAAVETGYNEGVGAELRTSVLQAVERTVRSNQLLGEHRLGSRGELEWAATSSGVRRSEPDRSEFVENLGTATPTWYSLFSEGAVRTFGDLDESSLEGSVDYHLTLGSGDRHRLSVGGLYQSTDRDAAGASFSITGVGLSPEDLALSPEQIFDGRFSGSGDEFFNIVPLGQGGSYTAEDRLAAGYAMLEYGLSERIRVIGGARVENSRRDIASESTFGDLSVATPEYTDVLPSLALNVDLSDRQKLRFSAAQTLARPEYRELAGVVYRDVLDKMLITGNPELERSLIQNYDVRWELYPASDEVFSVGLFAKRFQDPIERVFLTSSAGDLVTFVNAESALNYGMEIEARSRLGRLGAWGEAFSVSANATFVQSEVETVGEDENRRMVGQSPWVVNAGLTYAPDAGRVAATLLYNAYGDRISSAGSGFLPDIVEQTRHLVDFSFRFRVHDGLSLKLDAENLLDAAYEEVQGNVVRERYEPGRSLSVGATWRP